METAATATAQPVRYERRRAGSVRPNGAVFVERRRPVLLLEVEDLNDGDLQEVLSDGLDYVGSTAVAAADELAALIVATAPAALTAHDLGSRR